MSLSPYMILLRLAICLLWAYILSTLRLSMVITIILINFFFVYAFTLTLWSLIYIS